MNILIRCIAWGVAFVVIGLLAGYFGFYSGATQAGYTATTGQLTQSLINHVPQNLAIGIVCGLASTLRKKLFAKRTK